MTDPHTSTNTEEIPEQFMVSREESRSHHSGSDAFREFIGSGQGPRITKEIEHRGATDCLPQHATKTGEPFTGERLIIPAGTYKVCNNDYTCRFRTYSAFACLSGLGGEREPDSVLVLEPKENGSREAVLYFEPRTSCSAQEFHSDPQYGEFRVGARPSLEEVYQEMGFRCTHIDALPDTLVKDMGRVKLRIVRGADASIEAMINEIHRQAGLPFGKEARSADEAFEERLPETRLHRDAFELVEFTRAVEVTHTGFENIVRALSRAVGYRCGEHIVRDAFGAVAREEGNGLGYDTVVTLGNHANTLHWIDNDGPVDEGDLILVDAGVEVDSLHTTDIARTLLVNGCSTEAQARVYQAVLDARGAALARTSEPGTRFRDVRDTAMPIITMHLREWDLPPASVGEFLSPADQQHRCWIPHGMSHHLDLSVHDCAQARCEMYQDALLKPDMTFAIEPGLCFHADDEAVPTEYRGIGVRIEGDVVVNEDGSVARIPEDIPHTIDDVEAWIVRAQGC